MSYKRRKIISALKEYGFEFLREGGNHSIYTNNKINIPIGRHKEIDRDTARLIAKEIGIEWDIFKNNISWMEITNNEYSNCWNLERWKILHCTMSRTLKLLHPGQNHWRNYPQYKRGHNTYPKYQTAKIKCYLKRRPCQRSLTSGDTLVTVFLRCEKL